MKNFYSYSNVGVNLKNLAYARLLDLSKSGHDPFNDIAENAMDFCERNNIDVENEEEAKTKASNHIVEKIKSLLDAYYKSHPEANPYESSGLIKGFVKKIKINQIDINKFNELINNASPQLLVEVILRIRPESTANYDYEFSPKPTHLDEKSPIADKSNPRVLAIKESIKEDIEKEAKTEAQY